MEYDILGALSRYWNKSEINLHFFSYPLLSLVLVWILSVALTKTWMKSTGENDRVKKVFYIYRAFIVAAFAVMGFLIFGIFYWWAKGIYVRRSFELSHLFTLLLLWLIIIGAALVLRGFYTRDTMKEIMAQPFSANQQNAYNIVVRKEFLKNRWAVLLGAIGFAGLFFLVMRSTVLLSIVIDDSGSMGESLKIGREALSATFKRFDSRYTQVVITSFGNNNPQPTTPFSSFTQLTSVKNATQVEANTRICNSLADANEFINGLQATKGYGLNQAIWNNYLTSQQQYQANPTLYGDRVMLIISDGLEFNRGWYNKTICDQDIGLSAFFQDNIHWIDLLDRGSADAKDVNQNGFYKMMEECYSANIYPGLNMEEYSSALQTVLNSFELEWHLPIIVAIFFVIGTVIFLFITPKSLHIA